MQSSRNKTINIPDFIEREIIDEDKKDIDNSTLDNILNNLPESNEPNPKKGTNKKISEKFNNIKAELKFINIKESKIDILSNIKDKAGIYMFFNLINGNTYIGSSVKLDRRFRAHLSSILSVNLPLYKSFLKNGLNNFAFLILQFCDKEEDICLGLEQHYLDFYHPNYNILRLAGSSKGFKHSPETIAKLKVLHSGKLHPRWNTKVSEQQKKLTSLALKNYFNNNIHHNKGKKGVLAPQYGINGTIIIMKSEKGETLKFPSINSARLHFRVRFNTISKNINTDLPVLINGIKWYIISSPAAPMQQLAKASNDN